MYSLPDNTRLKEMIKVDFEAQSDVMYPSEALVSLSNSSVQKNSSTVSYRKEITITILGTGRHVNEVDIVKSFLHHVKVPHGGDPTWRGDYISSGSRVQSVGSSFPPSSISPLIRLSILQLLSSFCGDYLRPTPRHSPTFPEEIRRSNRQNPRNRSSRDH